MTKRLFLILIFLLTLSFKIYADVPEILIKPKNEEYTRLSSGLSGSNITIISKEDLASQHGKNLPQILETYSGIDVRRLYDGVGGTNSSLDIRGFGEASKSNSLIFDFEPFKIEILLLGILKNVDKVLINSKLDFPLCGIALTLT